MPDMKPSWITRIIAWLLSWLQRRDATAAADTAAITRNEEAAHAAHDAQVAAPDSRSGFIDGVRDGTSL